jgi:hypothetical protein
MSEQTPAAQKTCSKCQTEKPATLQYFHADKACRDGLYTQCKSCRKPKRLKVVATARPEGLTEEEQLELDRLDNRLAVNTAVLDNPESSANQLRLANIEIKTTNPKERKALEKRIEERLRGVRAEDLSRQQQVELERIRAQYPTLITLPVGSERDALIGQLQATADGMKDAAFGSARVYLESQISELQNAIEAEREAELQSAQAAKAAQAALDKTAADAAAKEVMDWVRPFLLTQILELSKREKLRSFCLDMAEKSKAVSNKVVATRMSRMYSKLARMLEIITQHSLPPVDSTKYDTSFYTSGFSTSAVNWNFRTSNEKALLRHFTLECIGEKWAHTLPDAPPVIWTPKPPADRLENIESRIDEANLMAPQLEEEELRRQKYWSDLKSADPKRYEKESRNAILQVKGDDIWAQRTRESWKQLKDRNPEEYERLSLSALEPRNFELPSLVYVLPMWTHANPHARNEMRWPDGRIVQQGEIDFDYRTKNWYLPAEPVDAEIDFNKKTGPSPEQIAKMSPEAQEFYRDVDVQSTSKMFAKPVKITFRTGDRRIEGSGRDVFAHGSWWTQAEVDKARSGYSEKSPIILPPLPKLAVADSIAVKPETEAERAKWLEPTETPWGRYMRIQREEKEQLQRLLN